MTLKHILRPLHWNCYVASSCCGNKNGKLFSPLVFHPSVVDVRYKGHSKWQNIKNDKAKGDALKNLMQARFMKRIWAALRDGPPDPKENSSLQKVYSEAMKTQISFETLNRITQEAVKKPPMNSFNIDIKGPGESCFVISATGKDQKSVLRNLQYRTNKVPGGFKYNDASVRPFFAHLGIVWVLKNSFSTEEPKKGAKGTPSSQERQATERKPLTLDDAETLAIEVNAESASEIVDDNNEEAFEIICDPTHVRRIENELASKNLIISKAESEFRPVARVKLTETHKQYVDQFYEALDLVEEIDAVYDNLEQSSNE